METYFALSKHWKGYDVFTRQKMSTFKSSRPAVLELAARYRELAHEAETGKGADGKSPQQIEDAEKLLFSEMCEICLWGNATDLSLLTSLTYEDIQKLQGSQARKASQSNIIVNDLDAAFQVMQKARREKKDGERRVDIVLDNSGFELFVDLILAGYLLSAGLATTIVLHPKRLPWFVSDVTPKDFSDLLNSMVDPQAFYTAPDDSGKTYPPLSEKEVADVQFLFEQWSQFHQDGKLIVRPHSFWTTQGCYWRIPHVAPELYEDLKESELVLFKGDLNYRKLTNDVSHANPHSSSMYSLRLGSMGHYYSLHNRHRPDGPQVWDSRPGLPYLQGGYRRRTARGRRRAAPPAAQRRRQRGSQVGLEWQVGCRVFLGRQGLDGPTKNDFVNICSLGLMPCNSYLCCVFGISTQADRPKIQGGFRLQDRAWDGA